MDFNLLDAQRKAAEAFIASQRHEGWIPVPDRFDDGGFTGGNMERPALKRLLAEIDAGRVDAIVVYKVDRLSRSLLDFSQIRGRLDAKGCSFVSVTQQFDTTHAMGRLSLNILLSFAQFEREIISERTRDEMAAARKRGHPKMAKIAITHHSCYNPIHDVNECLSPRGTQSLCGSSSGPRRLQFCERVRSNVNPSGSRKSESGTTASCSYTRLNVWGTH